MQLGHNYLQHSGRRSLSPVSAYGRAADELSMYSAPGERSLSRLDRLVDNAESVRRRRIRRLERSGYQRTAAPDSDGNSVWYKANHNGSYDTATDGVFMLDPDESQSLSISM